MFQTGKSESDKNVLQRSTTLRQHFSEHNFIVACSCGSVYSS